MDARLKTEVRECTTRLGGILKEQLGSERFDTIETLRLASRQVRRHHRRKEIQFKRQFVKGLSQSRKGVSPREKGSVPAFRYCWRDRVMRGQLFNK